MTKRQTFLTVLFPGGQVTAGLCGMHHLLALSLLQWRIDQTFFLCDYSYLIVSGAGWLGIFQVFLVKNLSLVTKHVITKVQSLFCLPNSGKLVIVAHKLPENRENTVGFHRDLRPPALRHNVTGYDPSTSPGWCPDVTNETFESLMIYKVAWLTMLSS